MDNQKIIKIASITVGAIAGILLLILAFRLVSGVFTRAADEVPKNVQITDITQNSAKVNWTTGVAVQCVVEYGTSPTSLNSYAPEQDRTINHTVDITLLSPASTYYFQLRCGDKAYTNEGIPWTFATKSAERTITAPTVSPTPVLPTATPSPTTSSTTPTMTPTPTSAVSCTDTDCQAIKSKIGKGCNTQDYFKCVKKLTPTPTPGEEDL